jgi:hypothetical protein
MNLQLLQAKVLRSRLITEGERAYWVRHLAHMNPAQCAKLDAILSKGDGIPWTEQLTAYIQTIAKAAEHLTTKFT